MRSTPVVSIIKQSANVISQNENHQKCVCSFIVDCDVIQWEARAVLGDIVPERGVGELIEKGTFLKKGNVAEVNVDYFKLTQGEGTYTISIFAQDLQGQWSDISYAAVKIINKYNINLRYNSGANYNSKI